MTLGAQLMTEARVGVKRGHTNEDHQVHQFAPLAHRGNLANRPSQMAATAHLSIACHTSTAMGSQAISQDMCRKMVNQPGKDS